MTALTKLTNICMRVASTFRYLDDSILTILIMNRWDTTYIPLNHQLIKENYLIPKPLLLDLDFSITNGIVSSKVFNKRDHFVLKILSIPFLYGGFLFLHLIAMISLFYNCTTAGHVSVSNAILTQISSKDWYLMLVFDRAKHCSISYDFLCVMVLFHNSKFDLIIT